MRTVPVAGIVILVWLCTAAFAQAPSGNMPPPKKGATPESTPRASVMPAPQATAPAQTPNAPPAANAKPLQPQQTAPAPSTRFGFSRVDGGFLRLDRQSGKIAFCGAHTVGWSCEVVPEDRAALEKQIDRLQSEVTGFKSETAALKAQIIALKAQIAALMAPPPPPRPPAPVPDTSEKKLQLLTDEEIARARAYMQDAWRRLVEMLMHLQKDMMQKT
jgi:hypothetical protein